MVAADCHPGEETGSYRRADDPESEDGPEDDPQDDGDNQSSDLALTGLAPEAVDKHSPA
jgi:hypothetical protein